MTLLHYHITLDKVIILMDTIALNEDREPFLYTTKIYPLPHLNMVMCGTGSANFILDWFVKINSCMLVRDINHLNEFTQQQLIQISEKHLLGSDFTATIYYFGYSASENRYKCYVYRSTTGFTPEVQFEGHAIKPAISNFESYVNEGDIKTVELIYQQYNDDKHAPKDKKIGIGGEIIMCVLSEGSIQIQKLFSFIDYDINYQFMCRNLEKQTPSLTT